MKSQLTFISQLERCQYLPEREWQFQYDIVQQATADDYGERLRQGWRRFGHAMFRPVCPSCAMCRSLRVSVATFVPDRSQRRAWKANDGEIALSIGEPSEDDAKRRLYDRFHQHQHESKGWPDSAADYHEMFVANPFPTEEWSYTLGERLVGVGYVDRLADGLSLIYFYHEPDERQRSLGTFNVLTAIATARAAGLAYVYLGYHVAGCRSLEYKARFRPNETINGDGVWRPFVV